MNKKAFTMIELLTAIIILGVILLIAIPEVSKFLIKNQSDFYQTQESLVEKYGQDYFSDNRSFLPKLSGEIQTIEINDLVNKKYGKPVLSSKNNACSGKVVVQKLNTAKYSYTACLVCDNYKTEKEICNMSSANNDKYMIEANDIEVAETSNLAYFDISNASVKINALQIGVAEPNLNRIPTNVVKVFPIQYRYKHLTKNINIKVLDKTNPMTPKVNLTVNGVDYYNSGTNDPITVTIIGYDKHGIKKIMYSEDKNNWTELPVTKVGDNYHGSYIVNTEMDKTFYAKTIDNNDLESEITQYKVKFGGVPPIPEKCFITKEETSGIAIIGYQMWDNDCPRSNLNMVIPATINGKHVSSVQGINSKACGCDIVSVSFPDSVRSIGYEAFANHGNLTTVNFPRYLGFIGGHAFLNSSLKSINLPTWLEEIGFTAFAGSKIEGNLVLPENLYSIGDGAFRNNTISEVTLNSKLSSIGNNAFDSNLINQINWNGFSGSIGVSAFENNRLTTLNIPNNIKSISREAFNNNFVTGPEKFVFNPQDKTEIVSYAGSDINVTMPEGTRKIGALAFANTNISSVNLPSSLKEIGNSSFRGNNIKGLTIPSTVIEIGDSSFSDNGLEVLTLAYGNPDTVNIRSMAFRNNKLKTVVIPNIVKDMEGHVFWQNNIISVHLPRKFQNHWYNNTKNGDYSWWGYNPLDMQNVTYE